MNKKKNENSYISRDMFSSLDRKKAFNKSRSLLRKNPVDIFELVDCNEGKVLYINGKRATKMMRLMSYNEDFIYFDKKDIIRGRELSDVKMSIILSHYSK